MGQSIRELIFKGQQAINKYQLEGKGVPPDWNEHLTKLMNEYKINSANNTPATIKVGTRKPNSFGFSWFEGLPIIEKEILSELEKIKKSAGFKFWPFAE